MSNETQVETNDLMVVIEQNHLEPETSKTLKDSFLPFFEQAEKWKSKAEQLIVTDASQTREMLEARNARLALKDIRVNVEKERKKLKEDSLRKGKAIDGIANVIKFLIEPIEEHLEKQEKFIEIQEAQAKEARRSERHELLSVFVPNPELYPLADISEQAFNDLLNGFKAAKQKREEEDRIAAEAEIARQKAEAAEREKQRLENIRLKAEAEAREKQLAAEREKAAKEKAIAEAKAKAEQERHNALMEAERKKQAKLKADADAKLAKEKAEREKAESELKAQAAAKAKAEQERIAAEKKAAAAPDKNKLILFAEQLSKISTPELNSDEAKHILADALILIGKTVVFINTKTESL